MNFHLTMRLYAVEGALQRMIGTLEHRGFRVLACRIGTDAAGTHYQLDMDVEGDRDPALLCRQLQRLLDVCEVGWHENAAVA